MKKTIGLIVILLIALIMLTGCVNINYEIKVNKDGSGDVSYLYGFSKEKLESLQISLKDVMEPTKEQAEKNGYTTEYYEDDEITGFIAKKHLNDLSKDFSLQEAFDKKYVKDSEGNEIKTKKAFLKTTISQNAEIDLTSMEDISSMVQMKYTVKLPLKAKSNNANEVSKNGKELTWNLIGGRVNKIDFTADGVNVSTILLIVLVTLIVIGAIVYVLVFVIFKKKKGTK